MLDGRIVEDVTEPGTKKETREKSLSQDLNTLPGLIQDPSEAECLVVVVVGAISAVVGVQKKTLMQRPSPGSRIVSVKDLKGRTVVEVAIITRLGAGMAMETKAV